MPDYTLDELLEIAKARKERDSGRLSRHAEIRALARGDFGEVFRTGSVPDTPEPYIANLFRKTIEDGGRLFAEAVPSDRVTPRRDTQPEQRRAEVKEMALAAYNNDSEIYDALEIFGQDFIAAGITGIRVWPNLRAPAAKRFPRFERVDPSVILPEDGWKPWRGSDNVILNYHRSVRELAQEFPRTFTDDDLEIEENPIGRMVAEIEEYRRGSGIVDLVRYKAAERADPLRLEVVDFYSSDFIARCAYWKDRGTVVTKKLLLAMDNPTGVCPVQLAARITWGDEPMGDLDDSKGVARARNRYWKMLMDYFVQMVYGPTLHWNVKKGQGSDWYALSPDAYAKRIGPEQVPFQVFNILAQAEEEERTSKTAPRSREGEVDLNKATAAFLTKAQGQLNSAVKANERQFAAAKRRANEAAFAQDETWCNAKKEITGRRRGRRFAIDYTPKKDVDGDYSNHVFYGTSSGFDKPTHQTMQLMMYDRGLRSEEDILEADPDVEDVPAAQSRIWRARFRGAVLAAMESGQPDAVLPLLKMWRAFVQGRTPDEVINRLERELTPPEEPALPAVGEMVPETPGTMPGVGSPTGVPEVEEPVVLPPRSQLREVIEGAS